MLVKQCNNCEQTFSIRLKQCPACGQEISLIYFATKMLEKSRLRLALVTIVLILIVGFGWFWRSDSGSRWPLFIVFFLVAPMVPWILKLAYKHAAPPDEDMSKQEEVETKAILKPMTFTPNDNNQNNDVEQSEFENNNHLSNNNKQD